MVNYKQGKIYKIECNVTGLIYIGSTCKKKLSGRMTNHRSNNKRYLNGKKKYYSAFKVMENQDYDIILIEDYPCKSKDQLFARERYYTNEIECVNICKNQGLCLELGEKQYSKFYYETNIDKIKDYKKEYFNKNTSVIKAKCKEYYDKNTETIKIKKKEYYDRNVETILTKIKEYRDKNVDAIKIKKKEYYDKNTDKIKAKHNEKFTCSCGSNYTHVNKSRHLKTKKHLKYLEEQT